MGESRLTYLIKKYDKPYVSGELRSSESNKLLKRNQRNSEKHFICDELLFECKFFYFSKVQKDFVHYLVDYFSNSFKKLHGRAKKETIILAFIFYVKKIEDSHIKLENYKICKKYGLTNDIFILIICRVCDEFVKSSPITYYDSYRYNHEILSKNGGEI